MRGPIARVSTAALLPVAAAFEHGQQLCGDGARVSRFLHGRSRFVARPDDLYISSYPRSGTTWLQYMLVLLSHDGDPGFEHIGVAAPWFERNLALGRMTAADYARMPSPRVFKSHLPLGWLPRGGRYVYVERDGRDVAVSYYHLYRSHLGFEGDFAAFFELFLAGRLQYRSWFKHVAGWRSQACRPDVCSLRYEDMRGDLPGALERLNRFGGFGRSPARLGELAKLCSFEAMKREQDRFDHATEDSRQAGARTGQFIRSGNSGQYGALLSAAQLAAFDQHAARRTPFAGVECRLDAFLH